MAATSGVRTRRTLAWTGAGALLALAGVAYTLGVISHERYTGYFSPAWDAGANGVYFIQRDTAGFIWGTGWEHFTPPASSRVRSDSFSLRHLDLATGSVRVLQSWDASPLLGRTLPHYRGRIFNTISTRLEPGEETVEFVIRLSIPVQPSSEQWTLAGQWRPGLAGKAQWTRARAHGGGVAEAALVNGIELLTPRGREAFPSAIVAVRADGGHDVLIQNRDFEDLYPDGLPAREINERSRRELLEHGRKFRRTHAELVERHQAAGMSAGEASLKAYEDMEALGLLARRPRLVATRIDSAPGNLAEFEIPPAYFEVGLFSDIAAAIKAPGTPVRTGTGTYLKYHDDDLGPRLKAWREAGNDRFVVRTNGAIYRLAVQREDATNAR